MLLALPSALILAIGTFLSELAEQDAISHKILPHETDITFYRNIGLDEETSRMAVADATEELKEWEEQMLQPAENKEKAGPLMRAASAFLTYVSGALIVAAFFLLEQNRLLAFGYACLVGGMILLLVSRLKASLNGIETSVEIVSTVVVTAIAMAMVYLVSSFVFITR